MGRAWGGPSTCTFNLLQGLNTLSDVKADAVTFQPAAGDELVGDGSYTTTLGRDMRTPLLYSRNMRRYLDVHASEYDIIHGNYLWTLPAHDARRAAARHNRPYVLSVHGMLYPQALKVSSWKKKLILPLFQRRDLQRTDCLIATCETEARHIRDFGLTTPVAVVPNCIAIDALPEQVKHDAAKGRTVGYTGRLDPIKNIELLIQAVAQTNITRLVIVGAGDPSYETSLRTLADKVCPGRVYFAGFKSGKSLNDIVRTFDIQVLPSKSENFGMVVAEALAHGVPVIASQGTPWQSLESHGCGRWVTADTDAIAEAINALASKDDTELDEMGRRGQQLVADNFTRRAVAMRMRDVYRDIISGRNE